MGEIIVGEKLYRFLKHVRLPIVAAYIGFVFSYTCNVFENEYYSNSESFFKAFVASRSGLVLLIGWLAFILLLNAIYFFLGKYCFRTISAKQASFVTLMKDHCVPSLQERLDAPQGKQNIAWGEDIAIVLPKTPYNDLNCNDFLIGSVDSIPFDFAAVDESLIDYQGLKRKILGVL